jgi:hypothetical protein
MARERRGPPLRVSSPTETGIYGWHESGAMVRQSLQSALDASALRVVVGSVLVAFVTFTTVKHLAVTYSPAWSRVTESGDAGAAMATAVFALGVYLTATGLFRGVASAVERGRGDA